MAKPYKNSSAEKKEQIAEMFNNISPKYDFLNRILSLGIDVIWRKKAIKLLAKYKPLNILDIATGTGDFAIEAAKLKPNKIIGIDISEGMLKYGQIKINKKGLNKIIKLEKGDSENLQFKNNSFDASTAGFGVRNFQNLEKGLAEIYRILKPGGVAVILEFSQPETTPFKQIYNFYFKYILPFWGKIISKDNAAYSYLPESVNEFPYGEQFMNILKNTGFKNVSQKRLTLGIATIYLAEK